MPNKLAFIADMPLPVHGMSLANLHVFNRISKFTEHDVILFNTSHENRIYKVFYYFFVFFKFLFQRFEVTYLSLYGCLGLFLQLPIIIFAVIFSKKIYIHHHSYAYITRYNILHKFLPSKRLTHIFLSAQMAKAYMKKYSVDLEYKILDNSIFVPVRCVKTTCQTLTIQKPFKIGFIGAVSIDKGIQRFIEDTDQLLNTGYSIERYICGKVDETLDKDLYTKIVSKCKYLGVKYDEDKFLEFFEQIDLLYFPTSYANEAQPLVVYEALSAGVPVIASDIGTIRGQLQDPSLGLVMNDVFCSTERMNLLKRHLDNHHLLRKDIIRASYQKHCDQKILAFDNFLLEVRNELGA